MKKRRMMGFSLALAITLTLPGCAQPVPEVSATPEPVASLAPVEEEKGFVLPCYPAAGFHPITGSNRLNLTLAPLLYRGLFAVDGSFEAQKDLCESYTVSEDGLTWTFRLVETTFSDGSPLTAAEGAASLDQARKSTRFGGRLKDVNRIAAEGATIVVTLSRPNGALPALLDVPMVKETEDPLRPLGTGPYLLEEDDGQLRLAARPGAEVPLESIPLRTVGEGDDLVYAFDAGEISLVDTDLTGTNALGYSGRFEATDYNTTGLLYVGCNARTGPCRDQLFRQAVARAVDRTEAAGGLLAGHAVATALPIHPAAAEYDAALAARWDLDLQAAVSLLEQAGWRLDPETNIRRKGRTNLSLRLLVNQDNTYKVTVAAALKEALEALGCPVTVEKLPWDGFVAALKKGDFDLYLGETVLTADFDLEPLLGAGGALNYGGYVQGETAELLNAHRAARGEERRQAASALWEQVADQAPIIPICFKNGSLLTRWGQVRGGAPVQRDVFAGLENWQIIHF